MFLDLARIARDPDVQRRIILAAVLLSGGAPFTGCFITQWSAGDCKFLGLGSTVNSSGGCKDPPLSLNDPNFEAGATISLRTPAAGDNGATIFARTGVLVPIDDKSSAPMPAMGGPVATTGQGSLQSNVTVPLLVGVTVPAKTSAFLSRNLSFEAFAGAQVQNKTLGFNLTEIGLPGVASASSNYTTLDPALGAGIQYYLGTFYGFPTSLGASYTLDFSLSSHSVTAQSPNIPERQLFAHE